MPKVGGRRVFLLYSTQIDPSIRKSQELIKRSLILKKPQLVKRSPRVHLTLFSDHESNPPFSLHSQER